MNVNMQQHQRSLLAVMGIDIWIPKTDVPIETFTPHLYRDTAYPEQSTNSNFQIIPVADQNAEIASLEHSIADDSSVLVPVATKVETPVKDIAEAVISNDVSVVATTALTIDAFEIQAYCLESCLIVLETTNLTVQQLELWNNIQRSQSGQFFVLKWPFPSAQFQDGHKAHIYVQGFLDALKSDRKVLSLGHLPNYSVHELVQLASLQEMIEQPILKKRLWKFMQNKS